MASDHCFQDIHICGACRSEFTDICKFIQHKKECYLSAARGHGQVPDLSHLTEQCIQHLPSSDRPGLQLVNAEFHPETYQYSAAPVVHLENEDASQTTIQTSAQTYAQTSAQTYAQTSAQTSAQTYAQTSAQSYDQTSVQISVSSGLNVAEHSEPDCSRKDHSHYSYSLNSPLVSDHKSLDVAALYSYSWPAEPDIKSVSTTMGHVAENELALVADVASHIKNSMSAESASEETRNNFDISTENIAVYVMSPKTFASSIRTHAKCNLDTRSKSLADFNAGSAWPESHSASDQQNSMVDGFVSVNTSPTAGYKRSYVSFDGGEQHNDLMYFHHESAGSEMQKSVTRSGFNSDAELVPGSNNSTPCPEDLEVGHISAAMFGKKKQQEEFKIVLNVNNPQAIATASGVSQSDSYFKILLDDVDGTHGYIRKNAADAPVIEIKKGLDVQSKRRISAEKRERLQGVSDDLLSSPVKFTSASGARSREPELGQTTVTQVTNGNITSGHLPQTSAELPSMATPALTSYKAVFTSPSSGGHRLTTTQTELPESITCTVQGFSNLKKQLFSSGSNSLASSKSVEYKNISASILNQSNQSDGPSPHSDSSLLVSGKTSERRVNSGVIVSDLTRGQNKHGGLTLNHDLTLSAILGHQRNAAQSALKSTNKINMQQSLIAPPLNNLLTSSTKMQPSLLTNEGEEHHLSSDFNIELGVADGATHLVENSPPILVMSNLSDTPAYTADSLNNSCHTDTTSEAKIELPLMVLKDESPEALPSESVNNSSVVMVYKNNEGRIILVPNIFYSSSLQNGSQAAEIFQAVRAATGRAELPFENGSQNPIHVQQQVSHSSTHLDVMRASDNSSVISQHYYIQNLDANLFNPGQVLSCVDGNTIVTTSDGSYMVNQATNMTSNSDHHKIPVKEVSVVHKAPVSTARQCEPATLEKERYIIKHKAPVSTARQCEPATLEKERYIIKPRKAEGSSKSPLGHPNIKRTLHTSPMKELQANDVTSLEEDRKARSFTCKFDMCRYTTSLYKDFQRHCRRHTGEKPYQCADCGKTFNRSDKLKLHQRRHSGLKPFQCQICDYAAIEGGSLKKHMRIHTDERPFKCQICTYASRNSSQLIVHLRTHTGDTPFHCTKCTAKFKINSDLKRHMRIHTGEKPFQCDKCDYRSSNKGNLKTHLRINHLEEKEIHCPVCEFVTSSKKRLREHEKSHSVQVIKCPQCDYTCATSGQLRSHIIIHNSLKPFRCSFCSYSSKQSGNLKKHIHNMHLYKIQARSKNSAADVENGVKPQSTRRENVLLPIAERSIIHRRRSSASCKKLHTCDHCGSNFVREDSLRCHRKQHCTSTKEGKESKEQTQLEQVKADSQHGSTGSSDLPGFYGHQGIQQIVAAASKIFEENYGIVSATPKPPTVNMNSFVLKGMANVSADRSITDSQSHAGNSSLLIPAPVSETRHHKPALLQVPWEHRSYTLSDYEKSYLPHTSVVGPSSSHFPTKTQPNLLKTKNPQNKSNKTQHKHPPEEISCHLQKRQATKQHSPQASKQHSPQASKQHSPHLLKSRRVEKSFSTSKQSLGKSYPTMIWMNMNHSTAGTHLQQQESHLQQPESHQSMLVPQTLMSPDSIDDLPRGPAAESAVILAPQGTDQGSSVDSFYNIQLGPQYEVPQMAAVGHGSQELHQLPGGTMHIQLQPSAHIQIVVPGTSAAKCAQLARGQGSPVMPQLVRGQGSPVMPQQQVLLQVEDNSQESQMLTAPADSLNTLQTTGQGLPHILSHCMPQRNGQIGLQAFNNTGSLPSCSLDHSTNQLGKGVQNVDINYVHGSDIVQESMNSKEDPQITVCS